MPRSSKSLLAALLLSACAHPPKPAPPSAPNWGWGIRPGTRLGVIKSVDVAPTVGALLKLDLGGTEGRVLREIFR